MSVTFLPSNVAKKLAPKKLVERLVTNDLTLNRTVLSMLSKSGLLGKAELEEVALRVIKGYKKSLKEETKEGSSKAEALPTILNDKKLMVQRVQGLAVFEVGQQVKRAYEGERYEWLPSNANEPDPLHQLNYGKRFWVGIGDANGEDPGDRFGCQCGMRILVKEEELFLDKDISA